MYKCWIDHKRDGLKEAEFDSKTQAQNWMHENLRGFYDASYESDSGPHYYTMREQIVGMIEKEG